jgi:flavin reductase (DIM6/NTAB) family NADH-FMN oxidoreductase RutF
MQRSKIDVYDLVTPAFGVWDKTWFVLTAGDAAAQPAPGLGGAAEERAFNSMTVSWGGLGFIWGRPMAMVVVRPQRFTFEFLERSSDFTLCAFGEAQRAAINLLGTKSGRESDKMKASGLTPITVPPVRSPGFAQAELILACRKSYWQDMDPKHFLADYIEPLYRGDYHRIYFGEVVAIEGTPAWRRA